MCPWVGPHAPSFGRQLWGLPSRVEYLSPQGVLLPLVYGTTASPLWLQLRGHSAWQATPSWTVYRLACHRLLPWLRVTFAMVPDAAWPGSDQWPWSTAPATGPVGRVRRLSASDPWGVGSFLSLGRPTCVQCPGPLGSCSPLCSLGVLCCVCGVLGNLAPVHRCARWVCCVACGVSWATWLLFTGVPARCVVLRVRCPGPLGSCSPVRPLGVLLCVCGVLGQLAPVHRCARSVCCVACAVSLATWLLFTGVPARCVVLRVRCPGPLGCCSPVCPLGLLCYVCGVLGHLAPVHRCARWVCCSVCGVLGHLAPVHRCARLVCCVTCAVSWATWLLFSSAPAGCVVVCAESWATWFLFGGAPARCVALRVRCPGPLGFLFTGVPAPWVVLRVRCPGPLASCSPVCPLGVLCCACGVLGHLAPVHRCARSVRCVVCAVSWATWLLFTCAPARCVASRVRRPEPLGSCSPVCPFRVLFPVCGVLGLVAPVHRCAAPCVVLRVRCPGPLGPVHRCACSVLCFVRAVSWATWLLFTGMPARCVVLRLRCPGPPGACSPVSPLDVLCCVYGVLGHLAPVHRCARSVLCFVRAVSWATWLLFTGMPARCVVLRLRCSGPPGACSPVSPLDVLCCVYGVLGHLAPVHRCARSVLCFACAVSRATWLLFTGVPARCVVLRVRCPGPPGSCSPVCSLGVLCCVCSVLGHLAPVHRCARSVGCVACTVSWAAWLLYNGVLALCALLWVARVVLCGRGVAAGRSLVHPDGGCS